MALDPSGLKTDIEAITNPATRAAAATAWADAMESYAAAIVPASTAVTAAAAALDTALASAFANTSSAATASAMETAFTAFATTVAAGMAPAFTGTPPPGSVGFSTLLSTNKASMAIAATDWSDAIQAWMITGTATPGPVNWS